MVTSTIASRRCARHQPRPCVLHNACVAGRRVTASPWTCHLDSMQDRVVRLSGPTLAAVHSREQIAGQRFPGVLGAARCGLGRIQVTALEQNLQHRSW